MSNVQPPNPPVKPPLHWPSLIQLIVSLLAAFVLLGAAAVIPLSAAVQYFSGTAGTTGSTESFMVAASLAFAGVLVLPSAWYAWRYIAFPGRESTPYSERRGFGLILTLVVVVLVSGALLLGNWASQNNQITWLVLPPLNVIATGLPALWVIYIGTRGLIPGTPRRQWGVFASGLVLGPLIILILELILLVFIGILALLWVMLNPTLANQLNGIILRLQNAGSNLEPLLKALVPFLHNPGILFLIFAFISVLVPLLEEALKPIGVWFLAGQKISPAQGFGYGVLSGAGFGLFENLGNTSGGASGWALIASTRISTLLLHSFTAGLVGWALASAWSERRYLRLAIIYAIAVIVHGLWNGLSLLSLVPSLQELTDTSLPASLEQIGMYSSLGIVALGILVLLFYVGFNVKLQRGAPMATLQLPGESQPPGPPKNNSFISFIDEPAQPAPEINTIQPSLQENNPSTPESEPHDPLEGENTTTATGNNQ